jgi:ribose transport system ATP-binding protein
LSLLQLNDIHKRFGATVALNGVDLIIRPGQVHALIGENGAGKSTLLNILAGVFPPDRGAMLLQDDPYHPGNPGEARASGIAHIHQELSLCPHLSVAENILLGLEPRRAGWIDWGAMRAHTRELLADFGCDHIDPDERLGELSVADQQVTEICRALASNARVVLMDEPTSSLQQSSVLRLFENIRRLRSQGLAIIYISHFLEEIREIADSYTVLRDGQSVDTGELKSVTDAHLIGKMVGRSVDDLFGADAAEHRAPGEVLLTVRDLSSPPRVRSASFELRRGEILGIGGLIGAGRTELLRALFGLERASGEVHLRGRKLPLDDADPSARIRSGLGFLSEDRKGEGLCLQTSIADNLTYTRPSLFSRGGWIDNARQRELSKSAMATLSIRASGPESPVIRLSGGNQQKVALGRLLLQDPDILLLDEPTRGVDIRSKADIYREIRRLAAAGKAILMVSSYLPELLGVCDRIAVMSRGRLSESRPTADWTPDTMMQVAIGESGASERTN